MIPSVRQTNLIIFLGCLGLILVGVFYEHVMKYEPCPLCITQRAFFDLIGILGLIAFLHHPKSTGLKIYAVMGIIAALGGSYFAQHQLWLQSLPADQLPACGPSLAYMFEAFPFMDAIKLLLQGDGSCAEPHKILGFSFAGWSLMAFVGLGLINLWQLLRTPKTVY